MEAVFPSRRAVAGAGVAARRSEHRHHVEPEGNRPRLGGILHHDRHFGLQATILKGQGGGAVLEGFEQRAFQLGDRGIGDARLHLAGDVLRRRIGEAGDYQHLVKIGRGFERDGFRECLDRSDRRIRRRIPIGERGLRAGGKNHAFGPGRAFLDPRLQNADLLRSQRFALGRHDLVVVLFQFHPEQQLGLFRVIGIDRRAGLPALEEFLTRGQQQLALRLLRAVAGKALRFQNRPRPIKALGAGDGGREGKQCQKNILIAQHGHPRPTETKRVFSQAKVSEPIQPKNLRTSASSPLSTTLTTRQVTRGK